MYSSLTALYSHLVFLDSNQLISWSVICQTKQAKLFQSHFLQYIPLPFNLWVQVHLSWLGLTGVVLFQTQLAWTLPLPLTNPNITAFPQLQQGALPIISQHKRKSSHLFLTAVSYSTLKKFCF